MKEMDWYCICLVYVEVFIRVFDVRNQFGYCIYIGSNWNGEKIRTQTKVKKMHSSLFLSEQGV